MEEEDDDDYDDDDDDKWQTIIYYWLCTLLDQSNLNALNGMLIALYWPGGSSIIRKCRDQPTLFMLLRYTGVLLVIVLYCWYKKWTR